MTSVSWLLAAFRDGRADPVEVAREFGADESAALESGRRWGSGTPRALEGVPVRALGDEAVAFAAENGSLPVSGRAPLTLGGGPEELVQAAIEGKASLQAIDLPSLTTASPADLSAVLGALGREPSNPVHTAARIDVLRPEDGPRRKGDDLAASLLGGLGVVLTRLSLPRAGALPAAAPHANALLLPLATELVVEAADANLSVLALPGAWARTSHVGLLLAGRDPSALTSLGVRLHTAMGGSGREDED